MSHQHHPILVVDDDADIRETIVEVLEENGHRTLSAANGNEALAALRNADEPPCLILLDLMMPIMDGRAFREAQQADPELSKIPVIVLSAFRDSAETAKQLDAAGFLPKPVSLDALISLIDSFC
jgi:CheY-like chemotaxis protein